MPDIFARSDSRPAFSFESLRWPSIVVLKLSALSGHHTGTATRGYSAGGAFPDSVVQYARPSLSAIFHWRGNRMPERRPRWLYGRSKPAPTFIAGPATSRRSRRPQAALLGGPTALGKEQALNVGGVSEDASFFHSLCTLRPRRHVAGFL
jgi:hypothetical protein